VEAVGFVLALNPQTGADARMAAVLKSIFNGLPTGASLQFHLLGTPDIHDFLDRYRGLRSVGGIHAHGESRPPGAGPSIWPGPRSIPLSRACPGCRATSWPPCR
jgi:hypothetical protein